MLSRFSDVKEFLKDYSYEIVIGALIFVGVGLAITHPEWFPEEVEEEGERLVVEVHHYNH